MFLGEVSRCLLLGAQKKLLYQKNQCWLSVASAKRCFAHLDFSQEQAGEAELFGVSFHHLS